jgi:hypothetical protein
MGVKRVTVHCVDIEDKPGSLHRLLSQSNLSGVDYLCFAAFSCSSNRSRVIVGVKNPEAFEAFVREAGVKATVAAGFLLDGEDRLGEAAKIIAKLAENDIGGIACAAIAHNGQFHMLIVVDAKNADRTHKALCD